MTDGPLLYVENLKHGSNEMTIRQLLDKSPEITAVTFLSPTSAKVGVRTEAAAAQLIEKANYKFVTMGDTKSVVYVTKFDLPFRDDPAYRIRLENLPRQLREREMHNDIARSGLNVVLVKVTRDQAGSSSGVGEVLFSTPEDASKFLGGHWRHCFRATNIILERARASTELRVPRNAMVTKATDDEAARQEASQFGPVHSLIPLQDGRRLVLFTQKPKDLPVGAETVPRQDAAVLEMIEKRTVLVTTSDIMDEAALEEHMRTAGKVVFCGGSGLKPADGTAIRHENAIVQYETPEEATQAMELLDRTSYSGKMPIKVMAYLDSALSNQKLGLLQINEVPAETCVRDLRRRFQSYGRVLAVSVLSAWFGDVTGFVLFEQWGDAERADKETRNTILFPPMQAKMIASAFYESDKASNVCLACYGVPRNKTSGEFIADFSGLNAVSVALKPGEQSSTGFAFFGRREEACAAYKSIRQRYPDLKLDLLNGNIMVRAKYLMTQMELPGAWAGCVFFISGIPPETPNAVIYDTLTREVCGVSAAYNVCDIRNGVPTGHAVVIFNSPDDSAKQRLFEAARRGVQLNGSYLRLAPYQGLKFSADAEGRLRFPPAGGLSPRSFLAEVIRLNLTDEAKIQHALSRLNLLSIQQVVAFCRDISMFWSWVNGE